ncbi:MAG: hypothetical protein DLM50_00555 [Candidatus Meridianibacter frigidus]|nr:MAG: hypothetical protein DLM50_00555 [Candidatus Eremiobacteraeota bacterium]
MIFDRGVIFALLVIAAAQAPAPAGVQNAQQRWTSSNLRSIAATKDAHKRAAIRASFEQVLQAARIAAVVPAPHSDPRTTAAAILSNHRLYHFTTGSASQPESWLVRAWNWFTDRWSRLLRLLFSRGQGGTLASGLGDLILLLAGLGFLYFLARIAYAYVRPQGAAATGSIPMRRTPTSDDLYVQAQGAARSGEYVRAVALLFQAALAALGLNNERALRPETVGALRRRVRANSAELSISFDVIAKALTAAIYAERPMGEADFATSSRAFERLRHSAGQLAAGQ